MIENMCDFGYVIFSYIRGYSLRLNPKSTNDSRYYLDSIVRPEMELPEIVKMLDYCDNLTEKYSSCLFTFNF